MNTRVCTKCLVEKILEVDFSKRKSGTFRWECKMCVAAISAEWREINGPAHNIKRRDNHKNDPRPGLLSNAKIRAKTKGLEFNLTLEDIVVPEICPVLGIPLYVDGAKQSANSPSLDRLVPGRGYVVGNVAVISLRANAAKGDLTSKELFRLAQWAEEMGV